VSGADLLVDLGEYVGDDGDLVGGNEAEGLDEVVEGALEEGVGKGEGGGENGGGGGGRRRCHGDDEMEGTEALTSAARKNADPARKIRRSKIVEEDTVARSRRYSSDFTSSGFGPGTERVQVGTFGSFGSIQ
jgi:hypothetical protein